MEHDGMTTDIWMDWIDGDILDGDIESLLYLEDLQPVNERMDAITPSTASTMTFPERERLRKLLYRRRQKNDTLELKETCNRLEARRSELIRRKERRLRQTSAEKATIAQLATTVQTMRRKTTTIIEFNTTLRESIRQQILLAMSYQRTMRHALRLASMPLGNQVNKDNMIYALEEQKCELDRIQLKWHGISEGYDDCQIKLNASQTNIEFVEILRHRRFECTAASTIGNRIWSHLTGESTQVGSTSRIAQRLDTIDPITTVYTRVYMCDDIAPFGLNIVQHRQMCSDNRWLIMYQTMDMHECFDDVLKWKVVGWLDVSSDGDDTLVKECIRYTQLGETALLPALLGCDLTDDATRQTKLREWMHQVISKLYSGCKN
ncbi:hypothetical protein Ae201684P_004428 [Aphanomyces euteiches]|uniref:Uncharacterized protein n=1 Tax=Aphanomyces euteiches TaxID=100861 RepID=A0A6G0XD69_9STRA|nr:hypothetical protein Ae201684_006001 [Aphanomyces euteiches]KAH9068727.1 hypothetical protein Ae201684P_004428 [Aphanomyces euteiches]